MLPVYLLIALAVGSNPEVEDALSAWEQGCAAIRSYDVFIASETKQLLYPNGSAPKAPLVERKQSHQIFQLGKRRIEAGVGKPGDPVVETALWDGKWAKVYLTAQELNLNSSFNVSGEVDYESWFRAPGADILRQRPGTKLERSTEGECVLHTPPTTDQVAWSPSGFRIWLDKAKNFMPRRIEYLLDVGGQEVVDIRFDIALEEVAPEVWTPVKSVMHRFLSGSPDTAPSRVIIEGTQVVNRKISKFNPDLADSAFTLDVPLGTLVYDHIVGGTTYKFGSPENLRGRLSEAVLRGVRPVEDLKQYALGPSRFFGKRPPELTITDARGVAKEVKLADFKGRWVLIEFWGLSCGTCISTSLPKLARFYDEHASDRGQFEILAICNTYGEQVKTFDGLDPLLAPVVEKAWGGKQLPFPILIDGDTRTFEAYGVKVMPVLVLIDPDGNVVEDGDEEMLAAKLKETKP